MVNITIGSNNTNTLNVNLLELYALEKSRGRDTSEIEAKLKKYGIPIPR